MVEIYWDDLTEEKQREILEVFGDNRWQCCRGQQKRKIFTSHNEPMTGGSEDVSNSFLQ